MVTKPQPGRVPAALPPVPWSDDYVCPDPEPRDMIQSPTINKSDYFVARQRPDTRYGLPTC